jgi:hypothetical protein
MNPKYCTGPPTFVSIVHGWSLVSGFGPIGIEFFIDVVDPDLLMVLMNKSWQKSSEEFFFFSFFDQNLQSNYP